MDAFIASLIVAAVSGMCILFFRKNAPAFSTHSPLLPLSIGAFLGVTFFELLPEAFHETEHASLAITVGFLGFFLLARALREYHHHHHIGDPHAHDDGDHKERGLLVLIGDSVHNLADGVVIATSFTISFELGVATMLGILFHEVPQEIAEFYILLRAGYSRTKALFLNFGSALSVVVGVLITNTLITTMESAVGILIGIAAGNLLYIAASDLLPTLTEKKVSTRDFVRQGSFVLVGLIVIALMTNGVHDAH
jgi:zinc and cadmium transporter